ncbi:azurin [Bizionia sediminis]|uniref:Azurin n=1 Tax=Bizionia sediminis TaxID=1737064 RepID=A0ABW5KS97_9FLAO
MKKLLVVMFAALAFSCGNDKKNEKASEPVKAATEKPAETKAPAADPNQAVVVIESNDQMKYNMSEIRVKAGQKVKLTLKHVGKMKKEVMGHNWVLLTQDADVAAVGQAGAMAADNDYIPADMTDKIIAYTKMIGGGQSDTIEFEAPAPGTYSFMCTFPGHYALMKGTFIVE